ncbi:MAG: hypothetical protein LIQ31_02220 [Planctomycetes bacterium]|nr:hypothetical protein [Planctomycetota bacterium]
MPLPVHNFTRSTASGGKFVVLLNTRDAESGAFLISDFSVDSQHPDPVRRCDRGTGLPLRDHGLAVRGGGWWKLDGGRLVLYGRSAAYGRFDPDWLRQRLETGSVFGEETLVIEG